MYKEELKHYEDDKVEGEDWFGPAIKTKIVQYVTLIFIISFTVILDISLSLLVLLQVYGE